MHPDRSADPSGAEPSRRVRVALDLLGGDGAPEVVADAVAPLLRGATVDVVLVGPPELAARLLADRGLSGAVTTPGTGPGTGTVTGATAPIAPTVRIVPASSAVAMDEDAVAAVRARPDCSVRVAAGLVRDGEADACVSVGHTGAALAAASFMLTRLPGVTRPAVAVVLPTPDGETILLDAGGTPNASVDLLAQFALAGCAYAVSRGCADPRVGLLTIGTEAGKGDDLRRAAAARLAELPIRFVGGVEGGDLARGRGVDVVVTDGFTGNVVLKALEGATDVVLGRVADAYGDAGPAAAVRHEYLAGPHSGALLLGVDGVSVVGHGASTADEVVAYVELAAHAVASRTVPRTAERLARLVELEVAAAAPGGTPVETAT